MKHSLLFLFLLSAPSLLAQSAGGFQPEYRLRSSGNRVADKQYYLLTVIRQSPAVRQLLQQEPGLQSILKQRVDAINAHAQDTCRTPVSLVSGFRWSSADSM